MCMNTYTYSPFSCCSAMILALPAVSYIDSRAALRRGIQVDKQRVLTLARGLYDWLQGHPIFKKKKRFARSPHVAEIVVALSQCLRVAHHTLDVLLLDARKRQQRVLYAELVLSNDMQIVPAFFPDGGGREGSISHGAGVEHQIKQCGGRRAILPQEKVIVSVDGTAQRVLDRDHGIVHLACRHRLWYGMVWCDTDDDGGMVKIATSIDRSHRQTAAPHAPHGRKAPHRTAPTLKVSSKEGLPTVSTCGPRSSRVAFSE